MEHILIADDDPKIAAIISEFVKSHGYIPEIAYDGRQALEMFAKRDYSAILLDVMMPHMNGFVVCRENRRTSNVPIIMITARGEDFERIMGLDTGADDYIVKPFSGEEVMARLRAIRRRVLPTECTPSARLMTFGNLTIDVSNVQVFIDEKPLSLTKKELEILFTLTENVGKLFSRDMLLNIVWGYDYYGDSRTVDTHIKRLRAKLDVFDHPDWQFKTVWGLGYRFELTDNKE